MAESPTAPDLEFQALVRKKYAGNPQAMAALGARLLVGRDAPRSLVDGKALIAEASQQGDAGAWCLLALLAAAGGGTVAGGSTGAKMYQARYFYALSKRTDFSIGMNHVKNDTFGGSNINGIGGNGGGGAGAAGVGGKHTGYAFALDHRF